MCASEVTREENGNKSAIDFVLVNPNMYTSCRKMFKEEEMDMDLSDHCQNRINLNIKENKKKLN